MSTYKIETGVIYFFSAKGVNVYQESFTNLTKSEAVARFHSHPYHLDGSATSCTVKEIF